MKHVKLREWGTDCSSEQYEMESSSSGIDKHIWCGTESGARI
jgi:hypothetical protein